MKGFALTCGLLGGLFVGCWFSYDLQPTIVRSLFDRPGYIIHVVKAIPPVLADNVPSGRDYVARFGLEDMVRSKSLSDRAVEALAAPLLRRVTLVLATCALLGGAIGAYIGFLVGSANSRRRRRR